MKLVIEEADLYKIYQALGNPHRRKIISLLGERPEGMAFSELKRELNISVGSLYYNIDQLRDLVYQREDKRYALTEKGVVAYKMLKKDVERVRSEGSASGFSGLTDTLREIFFPRWFFAFLESRRRLTPAIAVVVLLVGAIACSFNGVVLHVTWIAYSSDKALCASSFLWSWLAISAISFFIASPWRSIAFREGLKRLPQYLAEAGLAMFPLAIFVVLEPILRGSTIARVVAQLVLWLLALVFLSSSLSHVTRCRGEAAFLVVVLVMFVMTIVIPQLVVVSP
ncbi:MAG: hypothetical protein DRJ68_03300 [Thermoprotei archaeon]|nr:MAG: hypothetical protein DRJ68_03300 [Thermoprotei archaeon]